VKIVRSMAGIIIGFALFFGIVRFLSGSGLWRGITTTVAAALLSGYVTALIAGAHEFPHAAAVGMLMIVTGFVAMRQEGATQPGWYEIAIAGCGPISAMLGAAVRLLTKARPTAGSHIPGAAGGQ
jgi:hypothetical protein